MTTKELTPAELSANLNHFTGSEEWHKWSILFPYALLTDGALYLAEQAGAFWLMDVIGSYQPKLLKKGESFQVWKLAVVDGEGKVTCEDGNNNVLVRQDVPYTDFPLSFIKLYAIYDGSYVAILLPSEY